LYSYIQIYMIQLKNIDIQKGVEVFKALSDESRLRILNLILINDEMCISDLEVILDFTQTKTSRHLAYLRSAGIVKYKKTDQWVYYYIHDAYKTIIQQLFQLMSKDAILYKDL